MAGNRINFEVNFQVNQGNLTQLQNSLNQVITTANNAKATGKLTTDLREASNVARQLSSILSSSFNKDLGTLNIEKFNAGLKQSSLTLDQIKAKLSAQGNAGAAAFNRLTGSILSTNVQLQQGNKFLNDMATTMANTLKWGVASSVLNTMTNSIRNAYSYTKQLDSSLTSIRVVTGDSADEMGRFAEQANAAAKNLGSTTLDYTKSALSYYQQGLGDEAVAERTEATLKAANVTGARAEEVAENLTAVWNGFQAQIGTETDYVDKLAAVADSSASNLAELATAMSKTASIGNNVGVSMDQMNAQIATIIATTRQAPETVGNALKTIYARINDIKTGADGAEISLGNYTKKMESLGISVLDSNNNLRDTGDVFEEIGSKWSGMTREQQIYLAQTMAGQRQMNNLVALFDNWGQYSDMLNVSLEAQGTLDEKNARYLESVQAHLNTLRSTWQDLYSTLLNTDEINAGIDTVTNFVSMFDSFLESFGGGIKSISAFGTMVAFVFRDQIGKALGDMINNQNIARSNFEQLQLQAQAAQIQASSTNTTSDKAYAAGLQSQQQNMQAMLAVQRGLTQEQQQQLIGLQTQIGALTEEETKQELILNTLKQKVALTTEADIAEKGYVGALTEELASRYDLDTIETDLVGALNERLKIQQQLIQAGSEEAMTAQEIAQLEQDIARAKAAQKADSADSLRSAAAGEKARLQGEHDSIIQYVSTISMAKARTDMLLGSLTLLTVGFGAVRGAVSILSDETASAGEKFSRLAMLAATMGPMLATSIVKAYQGTIAYGAALEARTIKTAELAAVEAELALAIKREAIANLEAAKAQALANALSEKGLITDEEYTLLLAGRADLLKEDTVALIADAGGIEAESMAAAGGVAPNLTFGAALKKVGIAAAEALIPLLPYIAVIGAVAAAVGLAYLEYTKYDRAAEKAAEASDNLKQAVKDAKDEFNAAKQSLNSYTEAKAALADLTEGTKEWKMQVMEVNQQVLALLQEYPQLAQYIKNTNGVLEITAGGVDVLMNDLIEKQNKLMAASLSASAAAQQASIDAKAVNISRQASGGDDTTHYSHKEGTYYDTPSFSGDKETIEGLASAINNFPDAMGNVMKMSEASEEEIAAAIRDQMKSNSDLAQSFEGLDIDTMANAIKDNSSGLYELASSMVALNGTADLIAQSLVDSIDDGYKSKQDYDQLSEGDKKVVDAIIGGKVGAGGEIRKQAEEELQSQGLTSHEELKKAYLDTYGGTEAQAADMNVDALREAIITDIERRILADDGGLEQAIERSNQITSALESSGSKLDTSSKTALASYLESGEIDAFRGLSDSDLNQLLNIKPETLETLGLTEDKITELNNALEQMKENNGSNAPVLDFDVDAQELEQLTNELQNTSEEDEVFSENLRTNSELAQEVAESILRYKDAISDLAENYDDWYDTLESGDASEIFDELEDAYGDLLDMDGSQLSDDFKSSTENLELMKEALDGDTEAYNELADRASEDILANISLNDDIDYEQAAAIVDDVQNYFDNNEAWINARVGDLIIDEGLATQFENFANEMGLYGQEAVDAFNSAFAGQGIQAEIDEDGTPVQKDFPGWQNIKGTVQTEDVSNNIFTPDGIGQTVTGTVVTGIQYAADAVKGGTEQTRSGGYGIKFKKTANGGVKHNKARNFGGSTPKSRGGGGGGGGNRGKKGGGGGKKKEPAKKKEVKNDPYYRVNRQLQQVEKNLKKLQREEKKLTGAEYLANLKKQNEELEKQRTYLKDKADIAKEEVKRQQKELGDEYGLDFDKSGEITNYKSKTEKALKQVKAAYQKQLKDPSDKNKQYYEHVTENYQEMLKAIDQYKKDLDIYNDALEDERKALDQEIENKVKAFNYVIDVKLDTADFEKDWKEFNKEVLQGIKEDDYVNLSLYSKSEMQDTLDDIDLLRDRINTVRSQIATIENGGFASIYGDNINKAYEDLQKYTKELIEKGGDLKDLQDEIKDNWMDAIDAAQEAFDEQLEEYNQINDLIEHNVDMLETLYGDEAYEQAAKLYQQQANNTMQQLDFLRKETVFWENQMNAAEKGSDTWKEYKKNWEDSVNELNKSIEDAADYFYKKYEATFNKLIKSMKDALTGGDFDRSKTQWEDYLYWDDRYLDAESRAMGTYNVLSKAQDALANNSIKNQKELNKWIEATKENLEGQTKIRQIDLDIAEKELDVILKRQALEDARNNKTKMRLRRDSQGNYRYQYVADTDKIAQAQQELREAIEDLRLLAKEDFKDTVSLMYDQIEEFAEQAADISKQYGYQTEEYAKHMSDLQNEYIKRTMETANDVSEMFTKMSQSTGLEFNVLWEQMGDSLQSALGVDSETFAGFKQLFSPDGGVYTDAAEAFASSIFVDPIKAMSDEALGTLNDTTQLFPSSISGFTNNLREKLIEVFGNVRDGLDQAQETYKTDIDNIALQTGQNFQDLDSNMQGVIDTTKGLISNNNELINSYGGVVNKLREVSQESENLMNQFKQNNASALGAAANQILTGHNYTYQNGTNGVDFGNYGISNLGSEYQNLDSISQALYMTNGSNNFNLNNGANALSAIFAAGAEMVANQTGTDSEVYSNIMQSLAQQTQQMMSNLNSLISSNYNLGAIDYQNALSALQQAITINAEFPNAESAAEIKKAFDQIVNLASQYANGNRRTY